MRESDDIIISITFRSVRILMFFFQDKYNCTMLLLLLQIYESQFMTQIPEDSFVDMLIILLDILCFSFNNKSYTCNDRSYFLDLDFNI